MVISAERERLRRRYAKLQKRTVLRDGGGYTRAETVFFFGMDGRRRVGRVVGEISPYPPTHVVAPTARHRAFLFSVRSTTAVSPLSW